MFSPQDCHNGRNALESLWLHHREAGCIATSIVVALCYSDVYSEDKHYFAWPLLTF